MENNLQLYKAEKVFTGNKWLSQHTVVVSSGKIVEVLPSENISVEPVSSYHLLAPAFMDIQIYGAYGKLLSVYPEAESLHKLYTFCSEGGASHFQPTVATNAFKVFYKCVDAVRAYWQEGGKGCMGLHVEGPWINTIKKGTHIESFIHSPTPGEVKELLEYGRKNNQK